MPSCEPRLPLSGEALLDAVTDAMVALHLRYHGRFPATAKTVELGDDLLACTLGGTSTEVEKTMIELRREPEAHDARSDSHTYIDVVQRLSGRTVLAFIFDYQVGPDLAVELFWLAPPPAAKV